MYRRDLLAHAYQRCRANGGAPGVDGQTFADLEVSGPERWLEELTQALHQKTYRPQAVRRLWIPQADGAHLRQCRGCARASEHDVELTRSAGEKGLLLL